MAKVAQYCDCHVKDEKFMVRFAVFDSEHPLPKETVIVDATDCDSLDKIESKAFAHFAEKGDEHALINLVKAACAEGLQVTQPSLKTSDVAQPPIAPKPTLVTDKGTSK